MWFLKKKLLIKSITRTFRISSCFPISAFPCYKVNSLSHSKISKVLNNIATQFPDESVQTETVKVKNKQSNRGGKKMLDPAAEIGLVFIFQSNKQSQCKETVNS